MASSRSRLALMVLLVAGLCACRTVNPKAPVASPMAGSKAPTVYLAGTISEGGMSSACCWIGSQRTVLPTIGSSGSEANSVFVSPKGLIYAAGSYSTGTRSVPCRWTGAARTDLGEDENGVVNSVFVSSAGWPYSAGYHIDRSGTTHPCVWEGRARVELPGGEGGVAASVFVFKNKVYTAGFRKEGTREVACYWVNTSRTDLPCGESGAARSIFVSDGTVYTAGSYYDGSQYVPCFWTSTERTDLPGGSRTRAEARSICVRDQVIYTAGISTTTACYWKGTTQFNLPASPFPGFPDGVASANAIAVVGDVVYTAGSYQSGLAAREAPCYWMGTSFVDLGVEANGVKNNGAVLSIFVPNQ